MKIQKLYLTLLAAVVAGTMSASAAMVYYTDWTSATVATAGSANGTISDGFNTVGISYSGQVSGSTQLGPGGNYYWTEPNALAKPYTANAVVGNAPATTDIVTLIGQNVNPITQTITFSQPVQDPIMLIVSLGQTGITVNYSFSQAFTLLSSGQGYWGGGVGSLTQSGNVLTGREGHGAIKFNGLLSSISWTANPGENWHGFTVGLTAVPEPSTYIAGALLLLPFGAQGVRYLRNRRQAA